MSQTRRSFLKHSALIALAAGPASAAAASSLTTLVARRPARLGPNGKLAVASVGVGGMGGTDMPTVAGHGDVELVAICDMNRAVLEEAGSKYPKAARFQDWREMLAKLGDKVDAITCSTPDHMHAPVAMSALNAGKHVYCQKPLARLAYENRQLAQAAAQKPTLVTQMGTQRYAKAERRQGVILMEQDVVGKIKELHGWTDRPAGWWPCGQPRPKGSDAVPDGLGWDFFLGVAPERPYVKDAYTPFRWRGFYDFGTGAIGDMACHIMDVPFYGLGLTYPTSITCECTDATDDEYPTQETIRMVFPGTAKTAGGPFSFTWYDGGRKPDFASLGLPKDLKLPNDGAAVMVGENGTLVQPCDGMSPMVFREGRKVDMKLPECTTTNHWHDWVNACMGRGKARSPFQIAGLMCETLSLGAISSRSPGATLSYDQASMAFKGNAEATAWVRRPYRKGWEVPGLST